MHCGSLPVVETENCSSKMFAQKRSPITSSTTGVRTKCEMREGPPIKYVLARGNRWDVTGVDMGVIP